MLGKSNINLGKFGGAYRAYGKYRNNTKSKYYIIVSSAALLGLGVAYLAGAATLTLLSIAVAMFIVSAVVDALVDYYIAKIFEKHCKENTKEATQEKPTRRDSGIVKDENNDASFIDETQKGNYQYRLSDKDIRDIAKALYKWKGYIDEKGQKIISDGVLFTCSASPMSLKFAKGVESEFQEYRKKVLDEGNDNLIFTFIPNIDENHWVTLVVKYEPRSRQFKSYYCDSLNTIYNNSLSEEILNIIKKVLGDETEIRTYYSRQQRDIYNCGIFALKNADIITRAFKSSKSFDEVNAEISKYRPNNQELEKERERFAEILGEKEQEEMEEVKNRKQRNSIDSGIDVEGLSNRILGLTQFSVC